MKPFNFRAPIINMIGYAFCRSGGPLVSIGTDRPASSSSGGKIYYQYDEADDFDEEDPDDDLDI